MLIRFGLGEATDEDVAHSLKILLDFNKPRNFNPASKDNVLLAMDKAYTKTIFAFAENNIENSANFTMFEFRTAIELLKERNERYKEETNKLKK